ncbi:MAG: tRNA uridine-5-carboxymethylaminomethyl(34) synthesis enzyme MnmG [Clostridiales bacterium]|nr:tRNA uridine-5-carboxymethylaminomethyl(34) synthesis enzyme MnmG [Clostridiales bacterium]
MIANNDKTQFDAIVVGAGHAGIECALALAKLGHKVLICCINLDSIGYLACNPSIGGTAKAHLVREVDALGGVMGQLADKTSTQIRMLNNSKGMAVQSLRAQVDKYKYHAYAKQLLEQQHNIYLRQCEIVDIKCESVDAKKDELKGNNFKFNLTTKLGQNYCAKTVVLACGVYLQSQILIGQDKFNSGPAGFSRSLNLSNSLKKLGIDFRRFKTGTPARIHRRSVDLTKFEIQYGESNIMPFSDLTTKPLKNTSVCYLGRTSCSTHELIKQHLHLTFKYNKQSEDLSVGARYCPSIEDKVVRFADKTSHQFFLESEGEQTEELYVQGLSTSLPVDVQQKVYSSIEGLNDVEILRDAYAIEYDCIDPTTLTPNLMSKKVDGLFFAGQLNGTSGYEEAAAQGLVAGINASMYLSNKPYVYFDRHLSYIGVMIDDLVTQGTDEPYRMMTSRAEQRLRLRQDNSWMRLTPLGIELGLVCKKREKRYKALLRQFVQLMAKSEDKLNADTVLKHIGVTSTMTVKDFIKRVDVNVEQLAKMDVFSKFDVRALNAFVAEQKYEGYIERLDRELKEVQRLEKMTISIDSFDSIPGLSSEAIEKLQRIRPQNIGQASRISGVTPSDINALIVFLKKRITLNKKM